MVELVTPRMLIRDVIKEDGNSLHAVFSDHEANRYMPYIRKESQEETEEWVRATMAHNAKNPRESWNFSILLRPAGPLIGWIGFGRAEEKVRHVGDRDFGYALGKEHWNRGFGTEALARVTDFAFGELDTQVFWGECDKKNPASARVMEKCGFERIAGLSEDSFCYRLKRADWRKAKGGTS